MSHFLTLTDVECNININSCRLPQESAKQKGTHDNLHIQDYIKVDFQLSFLLQKYQLMYTCDIENNVETRFAPYCEATEETEYLEFFNVEEEERNRYLKDTASVVRCVNGTFISVYDSAFSKRFTIEDGLVKEKASGPLQMPKRTKKARRFQYMEKYPLRRLYPTFEEYMKEYSGYEYDEENQAYGYCSNPNAQWDWYEIGGRWPCELLVRDEEDAVIQSTLPGDKRPAPDGYKWVSAARKSAVQWDRMRLLKLKNAVKCYQMYKQWFRTGIRPEHLNQLVTLTEDGIASMNGMVYIKGELLGEYLNRTGHAFQYRYFIDPYAIVNEEGWFSQGDTGWFGLSSNDKPREDWKAEVDAYIDALPDDRVIVCVDCHI